MKRVLGDVEVYVDADPVAGTVSVVFGSGDLRVTRKISAVQSQNLRECLSEAEQVVESGLGSME